MKSTSIDKGKVFLVGAGPGDPKLLTLRAVEALRQSDVVVVDALVNPAILLHARADAKIIDGGKRAGRNTVTQEQLHQILIEHAWSGQTVTRLKCGDPFVFGRGGEEAEALTQAGVAWEVVPGISAGIAAAAYAGIPVLHRNHASSVTFLTGHDALADNPGGLDADTLVIFMCGATVVDIAAELIAGGRSPFTPVALIHHGTCEQQDVHVGTLYELSSLSAIEVPTPVIAVVGQVVRLARKLQWYRAPPRSLMSLQRNGASGAATRTSA